MVKGDHAKYTDSLRERGVPVFTPYVNGVDLQKRIYGNFIIQSFPLEHDTVCHGFLITHPKFGRMLYITDTSYVKYRFKNINQIIIECNHDIDMIDENAPNYSHTAEYHMSLQTCKDFVLINNSRSLKNVILCHMSNKNIDEKKAIQKIEAATEANVFSAHSTKTIDIDLVPF